jgi:hypothetical protein
LLLGVETTRQQAALDELVTRAGQITEVEAVILVGSLAAAMADVVSDVDAIGWYASPRSRPPTSGGTPSTPTPCPPAGIT